MNSVDVLLLAFLIGVVAGLRSLTAPAVVAWAAYRNWLGLHDSLLSFMGSIVAVTVFTLLAMGELIADKLPLTPPRTKPLGLIARAIFGGLAGASIALVGGQKGILGALLGAVGGIVGAFGGYQIRSRLVKAFKIPDVYIALLEDAVAIVSGMFIVSRL